MNGSNSNTSGASVASVDYAKKGTSDLVADALMAEIARRLQVTLENPPPGNVIFSPTEPTDKTKAWWQTDSVTGIPIGRPKTWNGTAWVSTDGSAAPTVLPPARRTGSITVIAGGSIDNITFADIGTTEYVVNLSPTTQIGGTFVAAPAIDASHGLIWLVTNKSSNQVSLQFYLIPTGGITFDWEVVAKEAA